MRAQAGNVTIDGIEANEASNPTPINNVFRVNPDNVEEFKVTDQQSDSRGGQELGFERFDCDAFRHQSVPWIVDRVLP